MFLKVLILQGKQGQSAIGNDSGDPVGAERDRSKCCRHENRGVKNDRDGLNAVGV